MGSSLWAGISGLNASAKQMDVIGNNIANVNTIGFRAGKVFFSDVLSQSLSGGASGSMQVGRGVAVEDIATQFGSGSFETTSNATDVAVDGDGFFMVNDALGATYFTRAGAFHMDNEGYLVDTNGYKVQGYCYDTATGALGSTIEDISLRNVQSAPSATTVFSVGVNLNSDTAAGDTFNATQTVYDSLGDKHTLNIAFRKTEGDGYWGIEATLDNAAVSSQSMHGVTFDSDGNLDDVYTATAIPTAAYDGSAGDGTYTVAVNTNKEGQLWKDAAGLILTRTGATTWGVTTPQGYTNATATADATHIYLDLDGAGGADITVTLADTWANNDTVSIDIDQSGTAATDLTLTIPALPNGATIGAANVIDWNLVGSDALSITGYASTSVIKSLSNDGYASGLLKSLSVESDGIISGFFTNGQTAEVGQICLADFDNPWGLKRMGSNLFAETVTSGAAIMNTPGASGLGELTANSLEMSNTDIATEFINMITAQKAYQASARVITTTDAMMSELMNIRR
ncbi:MAG TPA: flagellar hook protein FlgE [Syntrophales bacterium]|nr:flagellar hook protein FlgE [Syntrophales bacterium]